MSANGIHEEDLRGKVAVVIDVLRATTVIVTALSNGARWIKTVATIEEAWQLASEDVLLGGERHALPIDGFDFSNSPLEYTAERVQDKGIALTTTNGTLALSKCRTAQEVLIGSFINHMAVTEYLSKQNLPVEMVCAGTNGEFSLDDFLCAGIICQTLQKTGKYSFDDLGRLAIQTWMESSSDIHQALSAATHYNILRSKGFQSDLDYCLQRDTHNILVKRNSENRLVKFSGKQAS